jgi:glucose-6-phosphate isomerase
MIHRSDLLLDFNNMMSEMIGSTGIEKGEIDSLKAQIQQIFDGLSDLRRLGQMPYRDLPYHEDIALRLIQKAKEVQERFDTILLLGIGGSALGGRFLAESLASRKKPNLIICDHLDASRWKGIVDRVDFQKTFLVVVSKSGRTLETLAAFLFFRERFRERLGEKSKNHLLIITDPREGPLRKIANEEGIDSFEIPPGVGGRFSVLTPAGLFPVACVGGDIQELLAGACRMDERCQTSDPWFNPALMSAVLHYLLDGERGRRMRVVMPYGERLRHFAAWFAQLWAESLGKRMSLKGKEIFAGTTPLAAVGPQDQHSQLQLYLEGPHDKTITIIAGEKEGEDLTLPTDFQEMSELKGRSLNELLRAERTATVKALSEAGRPNQTILLREINPYTIGQLLYMAEVETVFAGELYNVNPFDQPAVELIKRNIRDCLSGKMTEKKNRSYLI